MSVASPAGWIDRIRNPGRMSLFELDGRDVNEALVQALMVEPADALGGRRLFP